MDFIGGQGDQPFVFSSDMEVLEDFSPLSTNATYWKTNQDTSEGAMPRCRMRDACGGCAKGKYSQITGEEGMISATMNKRGGIRKEYLYTK